MQEVRKDPHQGQSSIHQPNLLKMRQGYGQEATVSAGMGLPILQGAP